MMYFRNQQGAIVVVIAWKLDLKLPMQLVLITTNVSSNPTWGQGVFDTTLCDKIYQW